MDMDMDMDMEKDKDKDKDKDKVSGFSKTKAEDAKIVHGLGLHHFSGQHVLSLANQRSAKIFGRLT